jgi:DNA-binding PadR family transcriptional regulator
MSPRLKENNPIIFALLCFFLDHKYHGYELYKHIQSTPEFYKIWSLKTSLFYGYLEKLFEGGYLSLEVMEGGPYPDRKVYQLTEAGKQKVLAWMVEPVTHGREMRQEFLVKLYFAIRNNEKFYKELINNQKLECRLWLNNIEKHQKNNKNRSEEYIYQYRIRQINAMIDWLSYVELNL